MTAPESAWEIAARQFEPPSRRWATPGDLAAELDPRMVKTPALELIDNALVDLAEGRDKRLAIFCSPQEGKALALDTPIATPSGWTTMGEIQVGDRVFDRYGEPCNVTWVSPVWRDRPCYEVITGDGDQITADAEHEWPAHQWRGGPERLHRSSELARLQSKNPQIIGPAGLNLPDADLPLDPYVLGVWLGDGHTNGVRITCAEPEIIEYVREAGWPCRRDNGSRYGWTLCPEGHGAGSGPSPFRRTLVNLGVWGNKHIPVEYLRASTKQRLALLLGLIDTDGYVSEKGQVEFCSIKERLATGVQELVFSLGAKATLLTGRATINGKDCGPKYRVRFYLSEAARLTRKAERCRDASTALTRYVWSRQVSSVPTCCIEVDSPTHTYLAGRSLLPTHNSERASHYFPLWMLINNPDCRIAIVSYSGEIARRWGWLLRQDIETYDGTEGGVDLGLRLGARPPAGRFTVEGHRGGVYCVGIAGSLTGRAVDLLVIDDPIKDLEQAQSLRYRDRAWLFWQAVAIPRMGPNTRTVLIQTRWNEDDLAGRLLESEGDKTKGGKWRVISIPAQCEDAATDPLGRKTGEFMVSARGRTVEQWEERRKDVGEYVWAALFQQRPAPAEGGLFKRVWWRYWSQADAGYLHLGGRTRALADCWRFATVDLAASTRTSADYTVFAAWARTIDGDLVLLDRLRAKIGEQDHFTHALPLVQRWQLDTVFVEATQHAMTLTRDAANAGVPITPLSAEQDKFSRALPASAWVSSGRVWLPAGAWWLDEWVSETAAFPAAAHDDQVDALSYAVRVAVTKPAPRPSGPRPRADPQEIDLATVPL